MDLAIKWLFFMAFFMWLTLCLLHIRLQIHEEASRAANSPVGAATKNHSELTELKAKLLRLQDQPNRVMTYIHYFMFIAGAMVVTIYNKKKEIIDFTQNQFVKIKSKIKFEENAKKTLEVIKHTSAILKVIAVRSNVDLVKKLKRIWDKRRLLLFNIRQFYKKDSLREDRTELLLKRLRDVAHQRNNISLLLIAALQENKNIKQKWQVDHLAKMRLMQEIQTTQKQIKELRSKYVNFQQLYLVTHQENIFLKNHVKKLNKDKAESDETLMLLVSKVYQSNDNNLKGYCTFFLVQNKDNIASQDAETKVQKLLQKHQVNTSTSMKQACNEISAKIKTNCQSHRTEEQVEDDGVEKFKTDEPKPVIRGLPGECVWTVKDKDGIIEKLYQYDHGLDYDNGDTIRRIREYSVYHDKECMLDLSNACSTTIIHDRSARDKTEGLQSVELPSTRNFLTSSPAFQKFLQNNQNLMMEIMPAPAPPLLCG